MIVWFLIKDLFFKMWCTIIGPVVQKEVYPHDVVFLSSEILSCSAWNSSSWTHIQCFTFWVILRCLLFFFTLLYADIFINWLCAKYAALFLRLLNDFVSLKIFQTISYVLVGATATVEAGDGPEDGISYSLEFHWDWRRTPEKAWRSWIINATIHFLW